MFLSQRIGFLGGGKIAQAMIKGFIKSRLIDAKSMIASVHPSDVANMQHLKELGVKSVMENISAVEQSETIFITLKPGIVPFVLSEINHVAANKLFISLATGLTLADLEKHLNNKARVIRTMSNTPMTVQSGCSVFVRGKGVTNKDAAFADALLKSVGTSEEVIEEYFDVITALCGSGPAFIFVLIESLADGAVKMGLPRDLAYRLASQTVIGAGKMVIETTYHPAQLKDDVMSPGGTTAAGLISLEKSNFRAAVANAVERASLRSMEISKSNKYI